MSLSEATRHVRAATALPSSSISEKDRKEALKACEALTASLETPIEFSMRILFSPHQAMALRLGVDIGLLDAAAKALANGGEAVGIAQLASEMDADPLLIRRIMRLLAGMGIFKEVAKDSFQSTDLSKAYVSRSPLSAGIIHITKDMIPLSHLPNYFSERGWKSPEDAFNGPFQYATGTERHIFDYLTRKPRLQQAFTTTMTLSHRRRGLPWYTYFPVNARFSNASRSDILLVDVGGGQRTDLIAFQTAHPNVSGRLILQDLPAVIAATNGDTLTASRIEAISHDFFEPQPIRNARCYYLRTVLHDWPDIQALEILGHIKEAMGQGCVLLIEENVLPETGVSLESGYADFTMMVCFASMERRLEEWADLLSKAGLRLEKLWKPEDYGGSDTTALLEVVRDDGQSTKAGERET